MRHIRITRPRGVFLGTAHHAMGAVIPVDDDRRAALLVAQGVAEHVAPVGSLDPSARPVERGTAPPAPEKAVGKPSRK